jgi:dephospho-CoA kinase
VGKHGVKPVIGILGGIGAGKSTVANEFAKHGCAVIDADRIAHELLETDTVKKKVVDLLGAGILDPSGIIIHHEVADIVFSDVDKLTALNNILHPSVLKKVEYLLGQYQADPQVYAIVLDMPLLAEVGWDDYCDMLIFVECDPDIRLERIRKKGFFNEQQIRNRENFQISLDKKACLADNMLNNNSDFSTIVRQVANIFSSIKIS